MTKRQQKAVLVPVETPDEEPPVSEEEQESRAITDRALSSVPATTTARLFRIDPATGREGYLAAIDANAFSIEYVKEQFGGGDYRVQILGPTGRGRVKGYKGGDTFTIDKAIPPKYPRLPDNGTSAPAPGASLPPQGSSIDAAIAGMLTSMISQQGQAAQQQTAATQAMMTMMMTMMKDHSVVMQAQITALGKPNADPLEQLAALKQIIQPSKAAGLAEVLRDVAAVKELLRDGGSGGGGDEHWGVQVAREIAPYVLGKKNGESAEPEPAPTPVPPHIATAMAGSHLAPMPDPATMVPAIEVPPMPNDLVPFASFLPKLRMAAAMGLSPVTVADAILDATDSDDELEALLHRPGLVADIVRAAPDLRPEYLDAIRQAALNALRESMDADDPPTGGADHDSSAPAGG